MVVILGTAHLSSTPGKRSPDGLFREYKYSREICQLIKERLVSLGINCIIDYPDDDMVGLTSSQELVKRVKIVNDVCNKKGVNNVIYVSIHVNASISPNWDVATGFSVYTSPGKTKSDTLATYIYNEAKSTLAPLGKKVRGCLEENFYVLRKTKCAAVLTENFFQNNKNDIAFLSSTEGRNAIVEYHVKGILDYLKK